MSMIRNTELQEVLPKWKTPLTTNFTSDFSNTTTEDQELDYQSPLLNPNSQDQGTEEGEGESNSNSKWDEYESEPEESALITILLPCIICNRTFSPSALERHSKICNKVNVPERRSTRRVYDSHAQRIKNTKIADYVPGVDSPLSPPDEILGSGFFDRSSKFRRSFGGTRSRESSFSSLTVPISLSAHRPRSRALSTPKTLEFETSSPDGFAAELRYDPFLLSSSTSEYGGELGHGHLPLYARALSPSSDCPYCLRNFGLKAYDRHVKFCKEIWERKQYEHQPIPKEKEIARERQEIRTKYKPIQGAISWSSLRSMSPGKESVGGHGHHDFATLALNKLFGHNNKHKSSQDSLHSHQFPTNSGSSYYGGGGGGGGLGSSALFNRSLSFTHGESTGPRAQSRVSRIPTRLQASPVPSNLNAQSMMMMLKSSNENLSVSSSNPGGPRKPVWAKSVSSSGYGPGGNYMSGFSRNSKLRNSLPVSRRKDTGGMWTSETKRVEPEGGENPPSLLISPVTYYNRNILSRNNHHQTQSSVGGRGESHKGLIGQTMDPKDSDYYDPYAKAAQQFEELLKNQPDLIKSSQSGIDSVAKINRKSKVGLNRALASVLGNEKKDEEKGNKNKSPRRNYNMLYASKDLDDPWITSSENKERFRVDENYLKEMMSLGRGDENQDQEPRKEKLERELGKQEEGEGEEEFVRLENLLREGSSERVRDPDPEVGTRPNQTRRRTTTHSQNQMSRREEEEPRPRSRLPPNQSLYSHSHQNPKPKNPTSNLQYPEFQDYSTQRTVKEMELPSLGLGPSKFCHQCGTTYPQTPTAKFCVNCGERRVIHI